MSVHLVGGGDRPEHDPAVYGAFVAECVDCAGEERRPRVVVISVREGGNPGHAANLIVSLGRAGGVDAVALTVAEDEAVPGDVLDGIVDGIVVGGGLTPAYLRALGSLAPRIRELVESGVPYLGFSAGAMIASDHAMLGGWRIGGVEIGAEEAAEDLDEVTVETGIGIIDVTVDVHAVQWGNLSRLIAAVDAGLVADGVAIDESTVLIVGEGPLRVAGAGTVWIVTRASGGVQVRGIR